MGSSLRRLSIYPIAAALFLTACRPPAPQPAPPPAPEVSVAKAIRQTIPESMEFTGTVRGVENVEIRARVKGFLQTRHAKGGHRVKAGDLLFTIDPRTFDAAVRQAQAEVTSRVTAVELAQSVLKRMEEVMASTPGAMSKRDWDKAVADRDAAQAQLDLGNAMLRSAQLDLEFTSVKSPIDGRVGLITIDEGALVGATEPTLLATVINDAQVYATFEVDEATLLTVRHANGGRRPGEDGRATLPVFLGLANEKGFPHSGQYSAGSNTIDRDTGTLKAEAIFDNKDGFIVPGAFVRLLAIFGQADALMIPEGAVLADEQGRYVLVLGKEDKVERRAVEVGQVVDRMQRVISGLTPDEQVVVNGLQRARPGTKVDPKTVPSRPAPLNDPKKPTAQNSR